MLNSESLEIVIGTVFMFLLISLLCSAIKEWLEGVFKWRAADLERALRLMLSDENGSTTKEILQHPMLNSLFLGNYKNEKLTKSHISPGTGVSHMPFYNRRNLPSYIPATHFATAFLDYVARGPASLSVGNDDAAVKKLDVDLLRTKAKTINPPELQRIVLSALDYSENDIEKAKLFIQKWFDGTMDRASGWYKRRTQTILFILGLLVAIILNIDTLHIMRRLTIDKAFREVVIKEAESFKSMPAGLPSGRTEEAWKSIEKISMPIGWTKSSNGEEEKNKKSEIWLPIQFCKRTAISVSGNPCIRSKDYLTQVPTILAGWIITALAVIFGAPFWFDVLNRFMVIRSTVKPHEKSPEESSEDNQSAVTSPNIGSKTSNISPVPPQVYVVSNGEVAQSSDIGFQSHTWKPGFSNQKNEINV